MFNLSCGHVCHETGVFVDAVKVGFAAQNGCFELYL